MRDFDAPPEHIEARARERDPEAWRSADTMAEAFDLRYRRKAARWAVIQEDEQKK